MKKTGLTLIVFTLMNFVVSMTSLVFNGILDKVAMSLNITVANTGLLNTMYSYGAALGVPIILIVFRKIERTKMLKSTLFITILSTVALIYSQGFGQLLIARLVMGVTVNSYWVLAISTVMSLSDKDKQGRTMAFLIMGASLSLVIGVPLTRALTSYFDWRVVFWILNIIMIISLVYFMIFLPNGKDEATELNLRNEMKYFRDGNTRVVIIYTFIMFFGYIAFYTYVTPYILELFPSFESSMSLVLVALGVASFVGNWLGGRACDRMGYSKSLTIGAVAQLTISIMLIVFQPYKWLSLISIILLIMSSWFTGVQTNTGIAQVTENKSSFMISINSSAFQLGSAIGSSLAAIAIPISGMRSIVYITMISYVLITVLQIVSNRKYS
ncbi:MAG TPA: MFS transporter [Clostridiales bacterium]|nr:MFS transporter [Clostridiales bacterium]